MLLFTLYVCVKFSMPVCLVEYQMNCVLTAVNENTIIYIYGDATKMSSFIIRMDNDKMVSCKLCKITLVK